MTSTDTVVPSAVTNTAVACTLADDLRETLRDYIPFRGKNPSFNKILGTTTAALDRVWRANPYEHKKAPSEQIVKLGTAASLSDRAIMCWIVRSYWERGIVDAVLAADVASSASDDWLPERLRWWPEPAGELPCGHLGAAFRSIDAAIAHLEAMMAVGDAVDGAGGTRLLTKLQHKLALFDGANHAELEAEVTRAFAQAGRPLAAATLAELPSVVARPDGAVLHSARPFLAPMRAAAVDESTAGPCSVAPGPGVEAGTVAAVAPDRTVGRGRRGGGRVRALTRRSPVAVLLVALLIVAVSIVALSVRAMRAESPPQPGAGASPETPLAFGSPPGQGSRLVESGPATSLSTAAVAASPEATPPATVPVTNAPGGVVSEGGGPPGRPVAVAFTVSPTVATPTQATSPTPPAPTAPVTVAPAPNGIRVLAPAGVAACAPTSGLDCRFVVEGELDRAPEPDEAVLVLVNPTAPKGAGHYVQMPNATVSGKTFRLTTAYIGDSGQFAARTGDAFDVVAVLVGPQARIGEVPLAEFPPHQAIAGVEEIVDRRSNSTVVSVTLLRPGGLVAGITSPKVEQSVGGTVTVEGGITSDVPPLSQLRLFVEPHSLSPRRYYPHHEPVAPNGRSWKGLVHLGGPDQPFSVHLVLLSPQAADELARLGSEVNAGLLSLPAGSQILASVVIHKAG